jgi:hypothetical protein
MQMKVGLSFSRCLRDIFEGKVDYHDVLVIVARTDVDPNIDSEWNQIWEGYTRGGWSNPEWSAHIDNYDEFRKLAVKLYSGGKIHQPRKFGTHPLRLNYYWLDCAVPVDELENVPAVKEAWEHYQMLAGLCS